MPKTKKLRKRNPVSKYMNRFNKSAVFRDKKHDYKRKPKNRKEAEKDGEEPV